MQPAHSNTHDLIGDLIRRGTIASVDLAAGFATVQMGDVESPPLRWREFAGGFSTWFPPSEGEQVIILCPEADIAAGIIFRGVYSDANPPPATGLKFFAKFPDGSTVELDPTAQAFTLNLTGKLVINAPEGVDITGHLNLTGDAMVNGTVTASTDVIGGGKSLKSHIHKNVQAGGGFSGPPQ